MPFLDSLPRGSKELQIIQQEIRKLDGIGERKMGNLPTEARTYTHPNPCSATFRHPGRRRRFEFQGSTGSNLRQHGCAADDRSGQGSGVGRASSGTVGPLVPQLADKARLHGGGSPSNGCRAPGARQRLKNLAAWAGIA